MTPIKITSFDEIEFEGAIYYKPYYSDLNNTEICFCKKPVSNPMPKLEVGMQIEFKYGMDNAEPSLARSRGIIIFVHEEKIEIATPSCIYIQGFEFKSIQIYKLWDWRGVIWEKE